MTFKSTGDHMIKKVFVLDDLVRKYTLINAIEHDGVAQAKSVLGRLLADNPELRSRVQALNSDIALAVEQINRLSLSEQKAELDRRLDAYENNANPGRLADEVVAEIRKAL